jgi:uncharacterized membrane protein (GlpM family)
MKEILLRFLIGGITVSFFSVLGDIFKPKSFAGLFGAAPSVALATLALTVSKDGPQYVSVEARSMLVSALALFAYASCLSWMLMRHRYRALPVSFSLLAVWAAVSFGMWFVALR